MTRVATLQRHGVVRGYQDEVCPERGTAAPCYGPLDTVKYGQVMLFIARAMVEQGYWSLPGRRPHHLPRPERRGGADPDTDRQTLDHRMVVTYVRYAGAPPDVATCARAIRRSRGVAAGGWGDPPPRGWFARAFWPALNSYLGAYHAP